MSSKDWFLTVHYRNGQIKRILLNSFNECIIFVESLDFTYIKEVSAENSIYWVN